MAINGKTLGTVTGNNIPAETSDPVLPKLVDHNTTEEAFQEAIFDVATQVDASQADIGYSSDLTMRDGKQGHSVEERLNFIETQLGIIVDAMNANALVQSNAQAMGTVGGPFVEGSETQTSHIMGTLNDLRINTGAVDTQELADGGVTSIKIANDTIINEDINANAGIERTKLETAIQTHNVVTGDNAGVETNLGADINIVKFANMEVDGVVNGPNADEAVNESGATDIFHVLKSDNTWQSLASYYLDGNLIPASKIDSSVTGHSTTAPVPAGTTIPEFLAVGANRLEPDGSGGTQQYGLQSGDIISFTDTTPDPDQTTAWVYVGGTVGSGAAADAANFVSLGVVTNYTGSGGIELNALDFSIAETIPNDHIFSGNIDISQTLDVTGNITGATVDATTLDGDTLVVNTMVDSNLVPDNDPTQRLLGTGDNRWVGSFSNVNISGNIVAADAINNSHIADNTLLPIKISHATGTENIGKVLTTVTNGTDTSTAWMEPPIGVEMVDALPTDITEYPLGVLVSLTEAADANTPAGIYRQSASSGSASWARLGVVGAIISKHPSTTSAGPTQNLGAPVANNHIITINGIALQEVDYTWSEGSSSITLGASLGAGADVELINFSDIATIGEGEVNPNVLSSGTLPSGVTVANATSASNATNNSFSFGNNWSIASDGDSLRFIHSGTVQFSIDTSGNVTANNNITAYGTPS